MRTRRERKRTRGRREIVRAVCLLLVCIVIWVGTSWAAEIIAPAVSGVYL